MLWQKQPSLLRVCIVLVVGEIAGYAVVSGTPNAGIPNEVGFWAGLHTPSLCGRSVCLGNQ